jgi:hypothetical protein
MTRTVARNAHDARAVCNELDPEGPSTMNGISNLGSKS